MVQGGKIPDASKMTQINNRLKVLRDEAGRKQKAIQKLQDMLDQAPE
jgi:hypothetical protein